jgi:uncharacterized membrane protein
MPEHNDQAEPLPFVAPSNHVALNAPWRWLKLGFEDIKAAPQVSLGIGLILTLMLLSVSFLAWKYGSVWIMFALLCGFVFVAPIACISTYAISAQLQRHETVSFKRTLRACFVRYIGTELVFTLVLLLIFLLWARSNSVISIFLPASGDFKLGDLVLYIGLFTGVSLFFSGMMFTASQFALPMIMHRDVDAITAAVTSVNAMMKNKLAMLIWGLIIIGCLILGVLTGGLLLILFIPAIGHAVWHGYLETIDASAYPRHKQGITSTARTINPE